MIRGIDHLVIAVPKLEKAAAGSRGPIEQWLAAHAASPFGAVLPTPAPRFGPLDLQRSAGARLRLAP